jgi:putative ATP-dependent endonuclease of OLD family
MLLENIEIGHFRSLRNCMVTLNNNTALVGQNGAGKSTVLQAIRFFFDPNSKVSQTEQTFGSDDELSVTATLYDLNAREQEQYAQFLDAAGRLVVTKHGEPDTAPFYTVVGKRYAGFDELRALERESLTTYRNAFKDFIDKNGEYGLTVQRSADLCKAELIRWEQEHPEQLVEASVAFTFQNLTRGQLIPTTRILYVPAVHDASDDWSGNRSPLSQMIDALVTTQIQEKPAYQKLQERWEADYQKFISQNGSDELEALASRLNNVIGPFVPGATVSFEFQHTNPSVPVPGVSSQINEDGVPTDIEYQGHGMQRALIMALLQAFDEHSRATAAPESDSPIHILLLIEEPELYQHPPRARHIRRLLQRLSEDHTANTRFRIVSTTHSPHFVSIDDLESIRIVRKEPVKKGVPRRFITSVTFEQICTKYAAATGRAEFTIQELKKNLHVLDPVLREAFFANAIVVVEGVGDVGVLTAVGTSLNVDLEAGGIVLTELSGKGQLPIAITVLELLGIKHYIVFDSDSANDLTVNQTILGLLNAAAADVPALGMPPTAVRASYAVLTPKLEAVMQADFGAELFGECVLETAKTFQRKEVDVMKNPVTAAYAIELMHGKGARSATLDKIVENVAKSL